MKKLIFSAAIVSALMLGACGDEEKDTSANDTSASEDAVETEKETAEETKDSDIEEDENMRVENFYTNKELNVTGTAGPMKYNISAVQLKKITLKTEEAASLFDANVGDEIQGITIALDGENTSEEDISFYLGQATIITNTKEQLEPDMLLSEHIEGEYLGNVTHEGYNFYVLKNSTVDQLESIEIRISAPTNSNFEDLGDDIKHIIEVNK
jgi:hypothetical protein